MHNLRAVCGAPLTRGLVFLITAIGTTSVSRAQIEPLFEFEERCHLPRGEYIKRLPTPHPASRMEFLNVVPGRMLPGFDPSKPSTAPRSLLLVWRDGQLTLGHAEATSSFSLSNVLVRGMGLSAQQLRGRRYLLNFSLPGDFVLDGDAELQDVVAAIEALMREDLQRSVRLSIRKEAVDALVIRGNVDVRKLALHGLRFACHAQTSAAEEFASVSCTGTWHELLLSLAENAGLGLVDETPHSCEVLEWTVVLPQTRLLANFADLNDADKMRQRKDLTLRLVEERRAAAPAALREVTGAEVSVEQRAIPVIYFDDVQR